MKISKTWIVIIVIILLVIGYYSVKQLLKDPTEGYILETVDKGEVIQQVSETGSVQATDNISLGFKALGKIENINVVVGQEVRKGQILASLDVNQLNQQLKNYQAALDVAKAQYQKLLNGYTPEDIKIYEDARDSARQDLSSAYSSAVNTIIDTYTKTYNALNAVNEIQDSYFSLVDQPGIKVIESRDKMQESVRGIRNHLDSIESDSSENNIDNAISQIIKFVQEISSSLKTVREMLDEGAYYFDVSSADKTSLDNQKTYINTALINITDSQQSISSYKIALQSAESSLTLRKAEPRQEDIDVYLAQIRQAEANVSLYRAQIYDAYLRSPLDGKITKINAKAGEVVSASQAVVNLLSSNPFQIKVDIYEQDIVNVKVDNEVEVTLIAFPRDLLLGKVVSIDPAEKIVDQVVYYEVTIDFSNIIEGIRPGMTADLIIKTNKKDNILRVSKSAVDTIDGKDMVEVMSKGKVESRQIEVGLEGDDYFEVVSGLQEGEMVVLGKK